MVASAALTRMSRRLGHDSTSIFAGMDGDLGSDTAAIRHLHLRMREQHAVGEGGGCQVRCVLAWHVV
jgi:hypothetical protein